MKPIIIGAILLLTAQYSHAQARFEPGYFITTGGQRTDCEIRKFNWKSSNPTAFQYRIAGGEPQEGTLATVAEFGITSDATFRRFEVNLDRSSDQTAKLTDDRNPSFKMETLFLRLLVTGKGTLYEYVDAGLVRFFYAMEGEATPRQLVYKRYLQTNASGTETGIIASNVQFKQQVFADLKCASLTQKDAESLKYERADLMRFFARYNQCTGAVVPTTEPEQRLSSTLITIRPGLYYNSYSGNCCNYNFGPAMALRLGIEAELVLPSDKNMWSVIIEPAYQRYSAKTQGTNPSTIDYHALDANASLRGYILVNPSGSLYIQGGYVYGLVLGGEDAIQTSSGATDISSSGNFTVGVGYRIKKFSVEFSYGFSRKLVDHSPGGYGGPGLILGYRLK